MVDLLQQTSDIPEGGGWRYRAELIQPGPIPPAGGPSREEYLDRLGRKQLEIAGDEYAKAIAVLGIRASLMPAIDFPLVEPDDSVREKIRRDKREQWCRFLQETDQITLKMVMPHVQESVKASMNALNYLEDHELKEEAHAAIHRSAFIKRGLFGCSITLQHNEYWTNCPINISHLRIGVSVGITGDFECSICGRLVEDCDHLSGETYPAIAKRYTDGTCSICGLVECGHDEGKTFSAQAVSVGRNLQIHEVSLVPRPRYPLARLSEWQKDLGAMGDRPDVRRAAKEGMLNCDADFGPCKGFNDAKYWRNS